MILPVLFTETEVESKVRTLYQSEIVATKEGFDYVVTGSGFLYNMVRVLVAFLSEVGKREPNDVPKLLEDRNRNNVPLTAPPDGLYLEKIYLSPEELIQEYGKDIKYTTKSLENTNCH